MHTISWNIQTNSCIIFFICSTVTCVCENQHIFESMTWELFDQATWNTSRKYQLESLRPLITSHVSMSLSLAPPVPLQGGCLLQVYLHSCCLCTATEIPNLKSTRRCEHAHVRFRIMLVYCCIGGSMYR